MAVALQRIEVLGLSYLGLGMYCTMFLVDFGADLWRVERPNHAVGAKGADDFACSFEGAMAVGRRAFNRNRKSIVLDFKSEELGRYPARW